MNEIKQSVENYQLEYSKFLSEFIKLDQCALITDFEYFDNYLRNNWLFFTNNAKTISKDGIELLVIRYNQEILKRLFDIEINERIAQLLFNFYIFIDKDINFYMKLIKIKVYNDTESELIPMEDDLQINNIIEIKHDKSKMNMNFLKFYYFLIFSMLRSHLRNYYLRSFFKMNEFKFGSKKPSEKERISAFYDINIERKNKEIKVMLKVIASKLTEDDFKSYE